MSNRFRKRWTTSTSGLTQKRLCLHVLHATLRVASMQTASTGFAIVSKTCSCWFWCRNAPGLRQTTSSVEKPLWNRGAACGRVLTQIVQLKSQIDTKQWMFHQPKTMATSQARDSVGPSAICFSQCQRRKAVERRSNRSNSLVKKTVYLTSFVHVWYSIDQTTSGNHANDLVATALLKETLSMSWMYCCWCEWPTEGQDKQKTDWSNHISNPNGFLSQKACPYLDQGRTLNTHILGKWACRNLTASGRVATTGNVVRFDKKFAIICLPSTPQLFRLELLNVTNYVPASRSSSAQNKPQTTLLSFLIPETIWLSQPSSPLRIDVDIGLYI